LLDCFRGHIGLVRGGAGTPLPEDHYLLVSRSKSYLIPFLGVHCM
jgi:hypothetical protein